MTNSFVSVPADLGQLNCAALVAGVIAGVLDGASFVSGVLDISEEFCRNFSPLLDSGGRQFNIPAKR